MAVLKRMHGGLNLKFTCQLDLVMKAKIELLPAVPPCLHDNSVFHLPLPSAPPSLNPLFKFRLPSNLRICWSYDNQLLTRGLSSLSDVRGQREVQWHRLKVPLDVVLVSSVYSSLPNCRHPNR